MDKLIEAILVGLPTLILGLVLGRQMMGRRIDGLKQEGFKSEVARMDAEARATAHRATAQLSDAELIRRVSSGQPIVDEPESD